MDKADWLLYSALVEINVMIAALGNIMVQKGICTAEEVFETIDAVKKTEPLSSKIEDINKALAEEDSE